MVLHKLADVLHDLGEQVVLVSGSVKNEKEYPVVTEAEFTFSEHLKPTSNDWVLYPEIVDGNPLNGVNVVRWLLNVPGERGGNKQYGSNDVFFHFSSNFSTPDFKSSGLLRIADYGLEYFKSEKRTRMGFAIMIRKSRSYRSSHFLERAGWPVMDFLSGLDRKVLNRYFNSLAVFVSYDTETYHSVQAALSGALSVVVPRKGRSRKDFYNHANRKYGVAYGIRGIPWALATRKKLRESLISAEATDRKSVVDFVHLLKSRLK